MLWFIRKLFILLFKLKIVFLSMAAGVAIALGLQVRGQYRSWGVPPPEVEVDFPGDAVVSRPDIVETRSLAIDAPPDAVWPWLTQMGYGRGGWYGFRQLDRPWMSVGRSKAISSDVLLEGYETLAEGDLVPAHEHGGFVVRSVVEGESLVLHLDDAMVREQLAAARADDPRLARKMPEDPDMPPFAMSWAFRLEPLPGDRTRLSERVRVRIDDISDGQRRGLPMARAGLFAMLRSQMLGIAKRAESQPR